LNRTREGLRIGGHDAGLLQVDVGEAVDVADALPAERSRVVEGCHRR